MEENNMTVTELRGYLNGLSSNYDDVPVVVSGSDHSYSRASAEVTDAEYDHGHLSEYFSKASMNKGSKKISVLLVD